MVGLREVLDTENGIIIITGNPRWLLKYFIDRLSEKGMVSMETLTIHPKFPERVITGEVFSMDTRYKVIFSVIEGKRADILKKVLDNKDRAVVIDYENMYMFTQALKSKLGKEARYLLAYKMETVGFERLTVAKLDRGKIIEKNDYVRKRS
ncbi:hypothetical protein A3L04_03350 [Thermococcus chitonophagus]|uniref:Uncharacterized protein n=1 Tax=Thermococcus chitonophagus TaxID=54262 RepID=A0A161K9X1_9EURY|nr:hypothetical protein [Thermococcus chitonophagus]ASJ16182.1 hypothetical protein A3L04_03350 [Thermococcus chitonophagus]CUX78848.1 hypothetical protein CHITON_2069 [Thermococcus chitonophagus]